MTDTAVTGFSGAAANLAYGAISDGIRRGVYPANSRLPSERELATTIGVSRSTLRNALNGLAKEGVVTPSSQRGWFVSSKVLSEPPSVLQSFTEMAQTRGLSAGARVLAKAVRPATFDEAAKLGIAPTIRVLEIRRLRSLDSVPVCVDTNVLARGVDDLDGIDFTDRSFFSTLNDVCGIQVARCAYAVQAVKATSDIAGLLGLAERDPVLEGRETTFDDRGAPLSLGHTIYRGDAYRFEADLYRPMSRTVASAVATK